MSKTLEDILGYTTMLGVVEEIKNGVPTGQLPEAFFASAQAVEGDTGQYFKVDGTRKTARQVQYGSASQRRTLQGVKRVAVTLIHSFEHIEHDPSVLIMLKDMANGARQERGRQEIDRQTTIFVQRFLNLRRSAVWSTLAKGAIYFDGDGNLLPSSAGAALTISFSVPANNQNQCNGAISATWATAGTSILTDLETLHQRAAQTSGYPLSLAIYGKNLPKYLANNTEVKELLKTDSVLAGGIKQHGQFDVGQLRWVPGSRAFFEDNAGTNRTWLGDNQVLFVPQPDPSWWDVLEGSYPVPTNLGNVSADGVGATGNIVEARGMFQYAKVLDDPVTIKQAAGDTFLPVLKVPGAIFIATVVF